MDTNIAARTELPHIKDVKDLFADLLGRDVDVLVGGAWAPMPLDRATVAEFVDDQVQLRAVAMLDLPLAVYTGAAVGLLPAGGARDMVDERDPSSMVIENLYEVLNVLTSVFNVGTNPHVKIASMYAPGADFPGDIDQVVRRLTGRLDLTVNVDGYGSGRLALIVVR
jgi:hypothetical protein